MTALTEATPIVADFGTFFDAKLTLTQAGTLGPPSNTIPGRTGLFEFTQDATGAWAMSYDTAYKFPGDVVPTLSTAPNAVDLLQYVVRSNGDVVLSTPGIVDYVDRLTAGADAVGAIAFLGVAEGANLGGSTAFGSTRAGSNLFPATVFGRGGVDSNGQVVNISGSAMTGTWRCLGWLQDSGGSSHEDAATLWTRTV